MLQLVSLEFPVTKEREEKNPASFIGVLCTPTTLSKCTNSFVILLFLFVFTVQVTLSTDIKHCHYEGYGPTIYL